MPPRILMILTSHRLDCFRLCIDMLVQGGSARRFDRVVILCSGVEGRHRRFVETLSDRHPDVRWEVLHGPRGRGKPISDLQNECVRRYPDALYFKLDEDTFVSRDWDQEMVRAYELVRNDPDLSLLTAVVTNNQRGAYHLLTTFPELGEEFTRRFNKPIVTDRMGPVWILPQCAEFMIRRFLDLRAANEELRRQQDTLSDLAGSTACSPPTPDTRHPLALRSFGEAGTPWISFSYPFSINCIAYDYRHWQEIGGVPEQDENGWGEWIPAHGKKIVLVSRALVHHYAFFVQQEWLDRTSLLEDIRKSNLPETHRPWIATAARIRRMALQVPGAVRRRIAPKSQPGAAR